MLNDRLVAHRGFQKHFPENTLLAMSEAIKAGAHFLELDIQFTADRLPILYHDPLMNRISAKHEIISNLTLEQAISCPAYEPGRLGDKYISETITPLTDIVALLKSNPDVQVFVELKTEAVEYLGIEQSYQVIDDTLKPIASQCILISFFTPFIEHAKNMGGYRVGIVATNFDDLASQHTQAIAPDFVFCDKKLLPTHTPLENYPFLLVIYEVDSGDEAKQLFDQGADMVETFDIGGILQQLAHEAI